MKRILICSAQVPFSSGGQEVLVSRLKAAIENLGKLRGESYICEILSVPFLVDGKGDLLKQINFWGQLSLSSHNIDLVIATKFPTYFINHPNKRVWLVHQHRQIYDLHGTRFSDFCDDPRDEKIRREVTRLDSAALSSYPIVYTISDNVSKRLKLYNDVDSTTLYPPLAFGGMYYNKSNNNSEDFILSVGRICTIKRIDLLIKSLPQVHRFVKCKIVGSEDEAGVMEYLINEIKKHRLEDRVEFLGRVGDAELLELYALCRAVFYAPFNEDYGFGTLEAMASGKAVVTATDSGGPLEFIKHEETGLIASPTSASIAGCFNSLIENKGKADEIGANGRKLIERLKIASDDSWTRTVELLISTG